MKVFAAAVRALTSLRILTEERETPHLQIDHRLQARLATHSHRTARHTRHNVILVHGANLNCGPIRPHTLTKVARDSIGRADALETNGADELVRMGLGIDGNGLLGALAHRGHEKGAVYEREAVVDGAVSFAKDAGN
jgi:hypothetical protein